MVPSSVVRHLWLCYLTWSLAVLFDTVPSSVVRHLWLCYLTRSLAVLFDTVPWCVAEPPVDDRAAPDTDHGVPAGPAEPVGPADTTAATTGRSLVQFYGS